MSHRDRFANTTRALADALEAFVDDDEGVKVCGVPRVPLPAFFILILILMCTFTLSCGLSLHA